uniref:Uncharacterized protein n=1 Tax=Knipowitschia caucasica TaxID=637954 RepID=A0AAV2J6P4_KNICA
MEIRMGSTPPPPPSCRLLAPRSGQGRRVGARPQWDRGLVGRVSEWQDSLCGGQPVCLAFPIQSSLTYHSLKLISTDTFTAPTVSRPKVIHVQEAGGQPGQA